MRKLKILIPALFILLSIHTIYSQSGWFWVNPKPVRYDIYDIQIVDNNTVYLSGSYGTICKSTNAGLNWLTLSTDSLCIYNCVYFINPATGFICCNANDYSKSSVLKTTNGGINWSTSLSFNGGGLYGIQFINSSTGYVCGSPTRFLKTTNTGLTWDSLYVPFGADYNTVFFLNANTGFIQGTHEVYPDYYDIALKTTNGGLNWIRLFDTTYHGYQGIHFVDENTGFVNSINGYYKSTNGGINWNYINYNAGRYVAIYDLKFISPNYGIGVGYTFYYNHDVGVIITTTNGGVSWNTVVSQDESPKYSKVSIYNHQLSIAGGPYGALTKSTNDGISWNSTSVTFDDIPSIQFLNSQTGYITGYPGEIYKTTDGSNSWQYTQLYVNNDNFELKSKVYFINNNTGFYIGDYSRFYRTTNSGSTWQRQLDTIYRSYYDIFFINPNTGFLSSDFYQYHAPSIRYFSKTTNSGITWTDMHPDTIPYSDMYFFDENTGFSLRSSALLKTTNGGLNWRTILNDNNSNIFSYNFVSPNTGYAAVWNNIYKTTNSGFSWVSVLQNPYHEMSAVKFVNNITGYVIQKSYYLNNFSMLSKTTDGGNTWQSENIGFADLNRFEFVDANTGYAVGRFGQILKTTNGGTPIGILPISNVIPVKFSLHQNYPNPFNPSSKISFDLPVSSVVRIKVYDITGRQVTTLADEFKQAGIYEVTFDGTNLASGIYFYKMEAGTFIQSKKMVLIK